jgi:lipid-A-disaccharide synthase
VHFISPSIWAWRRERIEKIRKAVSHMLLIFPFEEAIYRKAGIPATYVGHPLAYALPAQPDARRRAPDSAWSRMANIWPCCRAAARANWPWSSCISAPPASACGKAGHAIPGPPGHGGNPQAVRSRAIRLNATELPIASCSATPTMPCRPPMPPSIASGTATLEAADARLPARHYLPHTLADLQDHETQAYLPWVGLPNILANRDIVPELMQDQANPEQLADALLKLLERPPTA